MRSTAHQTVCTVSKCSEVFQLIIQKQSILVLFKLFCQVHHLIIIASQIQKFPSDWHQSVLDRICMILGHILFHTKKSALISHKNLQITAHEFCNVIIKESFFCLALMHSFPLDSVNKSFRKCLVIYDNNIIFIYKHVHSVSAS